MKKTSIWIVIALMAISLLGIILMQSILIQWTIKQNEEKFDKEVQSSLIHVEKDLAASETSLDILSPPDILASGNAASASSLDFYYRMGKLKDSSFANVVLPSLASGSRSDFQKNLSLMEGVQVNRLFQAQAIAERIDLKLLAAFLEKHLTRRGIHAKYHYGVYAAESENFIILDGSYVVEEEGTSFSNTSINHSLLNSPYRINLFETADNVPGVLYIEILNRQGILLKDVWYQILGSILFSAIILFCFAYTIIVIFKQKKLSEMRTDFINNMTHEFKTPIATINLAADSIVSPMIVSSKEKVERFAGIIKEENRRMLKQVEKVLQMALLERKDFNLRLVSVDIHQLIIQAVQNANLQVEKKGGQVMTDLRASEPHIYADQTHISNIISNLLDNANKYTQDKPEITVSTANVNDGVQVTVKDNGIGLSREQRKHIFDKFYRVHTGNRHDVKGFGLGLSYVKAIVAAHKGTIELESELGIGSSFILKFPFGTAGQEKGKIDVS